MGDEPEDTTPPAQPGVESNPISEFEEFGDFEDDDVLLLSYSGEETDGDNDVTQLFMMMITIYLKRS